MVEIKSCTEEQKDFAAILDKFTRTEFPKYEVEHGKSGNEAERYSTGGLVQPFLANPERDGRRWD